MLFCIKSKIDLFLIVFRVNDLFQQIIFFVEEQVVAFIVNSGGRLLNGHFQNFHLPDIVFSTAAGNHSSEN